MPPSSLADLTPSRQFGPWALDLEPGERLARLRSLRAIVRLLTGPRGAALADLLLLSETDVSALPEAAAALDELTPLDLRRVLSTYAGLARTLPPPRSARPGVRARHLTTPRTSASSTLHAAA